jgi:ribonucrease Y
MYFLYRGFRDKKNISQKPVSENHITQDSNHLSSYSLDKDEIEAIARQSVILAVQRCSAEVANEHTITVVELENDEIKGNIIGKNGRNIHWLEKTLGVEIVVDETPKQIIISGFNSIRRHIAKITLELLLEDGRIHPASIEEMYQIAKQRTQAEIMQAGHKALEELGISDYQDGLVELVGKLKFRTSYGQNMLHHSMEMARLAKLIAGEVNDEFPGLNTKLDENICLQGGLLHDIGKAMDEDQLPKGNHVSLGEEICDKYGLDWRIKMCISSHHNEHYNHPEHGFCLEAPIVDAVDNISGARLGARKQTQEAYHSRMSTLEKLANEVEGVDKSWIMRGGKELWVFFNGTTTDKAKMEILLQELSQKIEDNTELPSQLKIIGYLEDTIIEYAK